MNFIPLLRKDMLLMLLVLGISNIAFSEVAGSAKNLEDLARQWLKTEQQIDALEYDWQQQKNMLKQRLVLLKAEKEKLQLIQNSHEDNHLDIESRRADLIGQQAQLEQSQKFAVERIAGIHQALRKLHPQLPPPLASVWQKELAGLSDRSDLSTQLNVALVLLDKWADFKGRISVHEMSIENQAGQPVWVKQLYLGTHQAWFVSKDLSYSGSGLPHPDGWKWQFDQAESAQEIRRAIDIVERKREADWVSLPMILPLAHPINMEVEINNDIPLSGEPL